jgi:5,10-methenyltetrahydrofolate synthetase
MNSRVSDDRKKRMSIVTINPSRSELRARLLAVRTQLPVAKRADLQTQLTAQLRQLMQAQIPAGACVAMYMPIRHEPDVTQLFEFLRAHNCTVVLPVVIAPNAPLVFAPFEGMDALQKGAYGVLEPASAPINAAPDWLIAPCVGFNPQRYRLGYGGGYYDRTLEQWREQGHVVRTVGVAYEMFLCEFAAHAHDVALDVVVTEQGIF